MNHSISRYIILLVCIYLNFISNTFAVPFINEEPLNEKFIKELLALLKLPNDDFEKSYFTGRKIKLSEDSIRYDISYFPELPIKTSKNLVRLKGYDIIIPEKNFKASNCYSQEIGYCGYIEKIYFYWQRKLKCF